MISRLRKLRKDQRGASSLEFVVAGPVILLLIFGIIQISMLAYAHAGLQEAVEAGARYATIYPSPSDTQIVAKIDRSKFGLNSAYVGGPQLRHGTSNGVKFLDITMTYRPPINFVFFQSPPITMSRTQRAWQP